MLNAVNSRVVGHAQQARCGSRERTNEAERQKWPILMLTKTKSELSEVGEAEAIQKAAIHSEGI